MGEADAKCAEILTAPTDQWAVTITRALQKLIDERDRWRKEADFDQERAEAAEQRVAALEAKCDLLAASLKQADKRLHDIKGNGPALLQRADLAEAQLAELVREVREWWSDKDGDGYGPCGKQLERLLREYDPAVKP